jgi:hypothetical protein
MQNKKKQKVPDSEIRRRLIERGVLKPGGADAVQKQGAEEKVRGAGEPGKGQPKDVRRVEQGDAEAVARENNEAAKSAPRSKPSGALIH